VGSAELPIRGREGLPPKAGPTCNGDLVAGRIRLLLHLEPVWRLFTLDSDKARRHAERAAQSVQKGHISLWRMNERSIRPRPLASMGDTRPTGRSTTRLRVVDVGSRGAHSNGNNHLIGGCIHRAVPFRAAAVDARLPAMSEPAGQRLPTQRATKNDVEIAKIQAAENRSIRRFRLFTQLSHGLIGAVWIAIAWVPLQAVRAIVGDVAGKETTFDATVNVSLAASVLLSISLTVSVAMNIERRSKVRRLRQRTDELEELLGLKELQRGGASK
jgi:hypothetical protein